MLLPRALGYTALAAVVWLGVSSMAWSHGVDQGSAAFLNQVQGTPVGAFLYLGAKHMVTGYDHILFLAGVVFFLARLRDVLVYVSLFTLGHSITLMGAVAVGVSVNAYLVDALVALSVVYKAFDNLGGIKTLTGRTVDNRPWVFLFGLVHGLGLATKLQDFNLPSEHLIANLLAFNIGVELGQLWALLWLLIFIQALRQTECFWLISRGVNSVMLLIGFVLFGYQLMGYVYENG